MDKKEKMLHIYFVYYYLGGSSFTELNIDNYIFQFMKPK